MSTPTHDEITAAIMLLQSVPGIRGTDTLDQIERSNTPVRRMAADLRGWWTKSMSPNAVDLEIELRAAADRHGLRITTDPELGELIGHYCVEPDDRNKLPWTTTHRIPGTIAEATEAAAQYGRRRIAALYLLPEGGQQ